MSKQKEVAIQPTYTPYSPVSAEMVDAGTPEQNQLNTSPIMIPDKYDSGDGVITIAAARGDKISLIVGKRNVFMTGPATVTIVKE